MLIRGGTVLALAAKAPNFHEADVLIEDDRITEVGPDIRARDAQTIDASNAIVMPGFVDAHRRVSMSLFRNLGEEQFDLGPSSFGPDDLYAATLIGLLGSIEAGTTTVVDWADVVDSSVLAEAALQAHVDAGIRSVFVSSFDSSPVDGTLTTMALRSADVTAANTARHHESWAAARARGRRIHARAGLGFADAGELRRLSDAGLLGPDVTLVHGTHLDVADLEALAESGAGLAIAPAAEMAGGMGAPPLQRFLDAGIEPGLAVGDVRLSPGDMLAQMRVANSVQHAAYFDLKLAGKAGLPNLVTTREVIRYATIGGAQSIGLGAVTGSLEPGKQADVVVFRTDRPNIYPINDPIGAIVWGVDSSNLDHVLVGGKALMSDGALVADVPRAQKLALSARDRMIASVGSGAGSGT
jgi:cytosine/adenosine deaminase-related metal-dependent hydrolase